MAFRYIFLQLIYFWFQSRYISWKSPISFLIGIAVNNIIQNFIFKSFQFFSVAFNCSFLIQLKKDYGADQADVIICIVGNVISGQVTGDTAKTLSENFGKIVQDKNSMTINSSDTSISKATQLDYAIPASKIAMLSSGEFVSVVADNPDQPIELKMFHSRIQNDHEAMPMRKLITKLFPKLPR